MMKAPNTISRMKVFAGMSVREIAQASGTPNRQASTATPAPNSSVFHSACRCRARHLQALWNTLEFGAGVAVLACLFGVPLAWAISRTDMPAKTFIRLMVFGAFIIPPYLGAI